MGNNYGNANIEQVIEFSNWQAEPILPLAVYRGESFIHR